MKNITSEVLTTSPFRGALVLIGVNTASTPAATDEHYSSKIMNIGYRV